MGAGQVAAWAPVPAHGGEADAVRVGRQPAEDDAGEAASSGGRSDHASVGVRVRDAASAGAQDAIKEASINP